jgi:hypothetical protein
MADINSYIASIAQADPMVSYKECGQVLLYDIPGGVSVNRSLMADFNHPNVAGWYTCSGRLRHCR